MRRSQKQNPLRRRSGATLVEAAFALPVFFLLVFGMIDLGIGVLRRNLVAEAARIGARQAIVHGSDAVQLGPWTKSSAEAGIRARLEPLMASSGIAPADFNVVVSYQQNAGVDDNSPGSTVVVRVAIDYQHIVKWPALDPVTLVSESSMIISN